MRSSPSGDEEILLLLFLPDFLFFLPTARLTSLPHLTVQKGKMRLVLTCSSEGRIRPQPSAITFPDTLLTMSGEISICDKGVKGAMIR